MHFHRLIFFHRDRRANGDLDILGGWLTDDQPILFSCICHNRIIQLHTADADRVGGDNAVEGNDGGFTHAAAQINDHVAGGCADRKPGAQRCGKRLLNQKYFAAAGLQRRLMHGAAFHARHAVRHTDHDARFKETKRSDNFLNEVKEHTLGHFVIGNDAILKRTQHFNRIRRAPLHLFCFLPNGDDLLLVKLDRYDGRLMQNNFALVVTDHINCAEIDSNIFRK